MPHVEIEFYDAGGRLLSVTSVPAGREEPLRVDDSVFLRAATIKVRQFPPAAPDHGSPQALAAYQEAVESAPVNWASPSGSLSTYEPVLRRRNRELAEFQYELGLTIDGQVDPNVPRCNASSNGIPTVHCNMRRHHSGTVHRLYGPCHQRHGLMDEWSDQPAPPEPGPALPAGVVLGLPGM